MDRKSSLRAYVRTKEDQAEVNLEAKGEEELELLSDPLALANTGILLTTNKRGDGKVVFSLRELPLHSEWRTSAGHTVARVSRRDVLICDVTGQPHTIDVPSETLLTILYLPDAVLQTIWLHLVPSITNTCIPQDIGRCRLVCRHWARMIEKMVVYERTRGIRFVIPSHPVQRVRSIYDSDDEDYELEAEHDNDVEESLLDGVAGRHTSIARLWVLSTSRPKPAPAKGILKRPADDAQGKSKNTKKSVRFTGLGDESEAEEAEKERRARESVRRKLTEGTELSKRFLASFFGWSKHHHRKRSSIDGAELFGEEDDMDDEDADDQESADSDDTGEESASTVINSAEEAWYRTNVFENQTRNLNRLKELEMRLEEMVRSKGRLGCKVPRNNTATTASSGAEEEAQMGDGEGVDDESRVAIVGDDLQSSPTRVEVDGWAESPVYMSPPEALPDQAREEANAGEDEDEGGQEGKPKRRRRDSFSGLLSSMSGASKKLLSR
ncbi:uncharacterized protein ACA1_074430 [Acanthamoeba castellanii str. Neff]|uniref:F-box domain-containing protein n=1 Tax=Acanthamoeba castellanii (strain ATCC 30010 / Neff) TaxID=1257118 RepID=L8HHD4_ACACF|nr:uncharacterized protein ACA1_074430 [Acanthamoeba castellanii str. Neff]ELR23876.1 hypothetical protein ACA1_074430 [Acanthamoeba castellanii str. Neff]